MAEHETHYEIRIGSKPNEHHRRTIGISPPLPQEIIDIVHEKQVIGLPFIRIGKVGAPDCQKYSELTFFPESYGNERRANNIALEIAGIFQKLIRREPTELKDILEPQATVQLNENYRGGTSTIDETIYPVTMRTWLFEHPHEMQSAGSITQDELQKLAA